MPTNFFVPVATGAGANVNTDGEWDGSAFQTTGVQRGIVPSKGMNKAWRQGTSMASVLGQLIVNRVNVDATDDGNITGLLGNVERGIAAMLDQARTAEDGGTVNALAASVSPAPVSLSPFYAVRVRIKNTTTSTTPTFNLNGLGPKLIVRQDGTALAQGDLIVNHFVLLVYDRLADVWVVGGTLPSDGRQAVYSVFTGQQFFIDPVNGSDTDPSRNGQTIAGAFKTPEKAFRTGGLGTNSMVLLADNRLSNRVDLISNWYVFGGTALDSSVSFSPTVRNLYFNPVGVGEAANSPYGSQGRVTAGVNLYASSLVFGRVNIFIPSLTTGLALNSVISVLSSGSVGIDTGSVQVENAGGTGFLMSGGSVQTGLYTPGSTLGANTAGRIIQGIAAGANPNASPYFRSNITSA